MDISQCCDSLSVFLNFGFRCRVTVVIPDKPGAAGRDSESRRFNGLEAPWIRCLDLSHRPVRQSLSWHNRFRLYSASDAFAVIDHRASAQRKNFISVAVTFVNNNLQTEKMLEIRTISVL
jgi:hypothetical protein